MFGLLVTAAVCLAAPPSLPACLTGSSPLSERTASADRVVLARIGPHRTEVPEGEVYPKHTFTEVTVVQDFKGEGPALLTLVQDGGISGRYEQHVLGDPRLEEGQQVILFLRVKDAAHPESVKLVDSGRSRLRIDGAEVDVCGERPPVAAVVEEIRRAVAKEKKTRKKETRKKETRKKETPR